MPTEQPMKVILPLMLLCVLSVACSSTWTRLHDPPYSAVAMSGSVNRSMIYLARVEGGIIVIDLGWFGARSALRGGLAELGGWEEDVEAVFLTHAHRDHIGAWRSVMHAPFYLGQEEVPLFVGEARYHGFIPRLAERLRRSNLPAPGKLRLHGIASDTAFVFGADTLRAFPVPGHTGGSVAYLFRGVLFAGDALAHTPFRGFRPARTEYSDDASEAAHSLTDLWERLAPYHVDFVCTAHAKCTTFTADLVRHTSPDPSS